jgi:hypothetical protein
VQRDGEIGHHWFERQPLERGQQADGRQRDASGRHGKSVRIGQHPQRLHRLVVVVEWFAHAHEHDVEACVLHREGAREEADLSDDFARRQIARESHFSREAERAGHGAAHLRRDAEGLGGRVGNKHRLDLLPVGEGEKKLLRAVGRPFAVHERRAGNREITGQLFAKGLRQVGHARQVGDAPLVDPAEDLVAAEALVAGHFEGAAQFGALHAREVRAGIAWRISCFYNHLPCLKFYCRLARAWFLAWDPRSRLPVAS